MIPTNTHTLTPVVSDAMATAERAFGNEVAHGFPKERAGDVEVANGFITTSKVTAGDNVEVAKAFTSKNSAVGSVEIAAESGFTTNNEEEVGDVEVANANGFTKGRTGDDAEVLHDFSPLLVVYKSGRLERPLIVPVVPAGHDAATGVVSKDVPLSPFSFVRLYLPPGLAAADACDAEKVEENATPNPAKKLPVVVYFHGGGFVMGSAASCVYHRFVNDLTAASPAVAVSVDYRLAPEHLLPAAYEDALAALRWVLSASDPWLAAHADPRRVFLAGDSAGGNICHHLAMHPDVRAAGGVRGVVLIHPWFWGTQPIAGELEHRRSSRREPKLSLWELVCPDAVDGVDDPRMNPTAGPGAPGLENLACEKVLVCVAEGDHLRWRGKAYAEAAARAGKIAVETVESEGVGHVFYLLDPDMEEARELLRRIAGFVRDDDAHDKQGGSEHGAAAATVRASLTIVIDHQ